METGELSDFYQFDGGKLGTVQSFGLLPPAPVLAANVVKDMRDAARWASPLFGLAQPVVRATLSQLLKRGVLLAAIMEDLPYTDNRVVPGPPLAIDSRLHLNEITRLKAFRAHVARVLKPFRFLLFSPSKEQLHASPCLRYVSFRQGPGLQRPRRLQPRPRHRQPVCGRRLLLPFQRRHQPGLDHRRQCSAHCGPFAERQPTAPRDARLVTICQNRVNPEFRAYFAGVDVIPHEHRPKKDLGGLPPAIYAARLAARSAMETA